MANSTLVPLRLKEKELFSPRMSNNSKITRNSSLLHDQVVSMVE